MAGDSWPVNPYAHVNWHACDLLISIGPGCPCSHTEFFSVSLLNTVVSDLTLEDYVDQCSPS